MTGAELQLKIAVVLPRECDEAREEMRSRREGNDYKDEPLNLS